MEADPIKAGVSSKSPDDDLGVVERFKNAIKRPMNLVAAGFLFLLAVSAEYALSKILDYVWEVENPDQVI